jgi:hypothetical protein
MFGAAPPATPFTRLRALRGTLLCALLCTPMVPATAHARSSTGDTIAGRIAPLVFSGEDAADAERVRTRLIAEEAWLESLAEGAGDASPLATRLLASIRAEAARIVRPISDELSPTATRTAVDLFVGWIAEISRAGRLLEASVSTGPEVDASVAELVAELGRAWPVPEGDALRAHFHGRAEAAITTAIFGLPVNAPAAIPRGSLHSARSVVRDACDDARRFLRDEERRIAGREPADPVARESFLDGFASKVRADLDRIAGSIGRSLAGMLAGARNDALLAAAARAGVPLDAYLEGDLGDLEPLRQAARMRPLPRGMSELSGFRSADGAIHMADILNARDISSGANGLGLQMLAEILATAGAALGESDAGGLRPALWSWSIDGRLVARVEGVVGRSGGDFLLAFGFVRLEEAIWTLLPGPTDRFAGAVLRWRDAGGDDPGALTIAWPDQRSADGAEPDRSGSRANEVSAAEMRQGAGVRVSTSVPTSIPTNAQADVPPEQPNEGLANGWDGGGSTIAVSEPRFAGRVAWVTRSAKLHGAMGAVFGEAMRGGETIAPRRMRIEIGFKTGIPGNDEFQTAVPIDFPMRPIERVSCVGSAGGALRAEARSQGVDLAPERVVTLALGAPVGVDRSVAVATEGDRGPRVTDDAVRALSDDLTTLRLVGRSECGEAGRAELEALAATRRAEGDPLAAFVLEDEALAKLRSEGAMRMSDWDAFLARFDRPSERALRESLEAWRARRTDSPHTFTRLLRWSAAIPADWHARRWPVAPADGDVGEGVGGGVGAGVGAGVGERDEAPAANDEGTLVREKGATP